MTSLPIGATTRSIAVRLDAKVTDYVAQMRVASQATRDFLDDANQSAGQAQQAWKSVGAQMTIVGAAMSAGLGLAVAKFADFDRSMSAAQAATQETGASLAALRQAALDAGAATQFSATEAADAITALGKAGVSTTDILGGGLSGSLSLAAAGQLDVGQAAEIAATAMTQFGLAGKDLPHVADLLAAGAGKAQGDVTDLANAMKFVGPVAKGMGTSIEETTGTLALFASQGIIGEQAGTSLRGVLLSLTSPGQQAAKVMSQLGINLYDTHGKFVGVSGAADQLQNALGPLDEATRNQALGQIFGNQQITAARILYEGGSKAVDDWTAKVDDAGFAARQAAQLTNNLSGDVERLGGAFDTALISAGSSANGVLREMVQQVTGLIDIYNSLPAPVQTGATAVMGVATAATLLGGGLIALAPRIKATQQALGEMGRTGALLTRGLGATRSFLMGPWGLALAGGVLALGAWADSHAKAVKREQDFKAALDQTTGAITAQAVALRKQDLQSKGVLDLATRLGVSLDVVAEAASGNVDAMAKLRDMQQGAAVSAGAYNLEQIKAANSGQYVSSVLEQQANGLNVTATGFDTLVSKINPYYTSALQSADATKQLAGDGKDAADAASGQADATDDLAAAQAEAVPLTQSMIDALRLMGPAAQASDRDVQDLAKALDDYQTKVADAFASSTDVLGNFQADTGKKAGSIASQLKKAYADAQTEAQSFVDNIDQVTREGLDPQLVAELLEQGPKQAGPILQAMVADNSGKLIEMANDSATAIGKIQARVLEQARLTNLAVHATNDTMVDDLGTAMKLAEGKARLGGKATADALAKELGVGSAEVERIAGEFGIALATGVSTGAGKAKNAVEKLGGAVNNLPTDHSILFKINGAGSVIAQAKQIRDAINSIPGYKSITVAAKIASQNAALTDSTRRAQGGYIPPSLGRGPTADDVPVLASGGEYFIKAAAVDHYGVAMFDSLNAMRFAAGGRVPRFATGGSVARGVDAQYQKAIRLPDAAGVKAAADAIDRLLAAWQQTVENADTANRRLELVRNVAKASRKDVAAARKELADFDREQASERVKATAARKQELIASRAQILANREAWSFDHSSTADQIANLTKRIGAEKQYTDEWVKLAGQREQLMTQQAATLNGLLDDRTRILGQLADAQARRDSAVAAANSRLAQQTAQLKDARRESLETWASLTEKAQVGFAPSMSFLVANGKDQVEQFTEWMSQLALARSRGLSENAIALLGLDQGPQALAQLRQVNKGTADQVDQMNALVAQRTQLAAQQADTEATGRLGKLGQDLLAVQQEAAQAIADAQAEFLATQTDLTAQLAQLGQVQGRTYTDAIAEGLASGIPGIQAVAAQVKAALADLQAQQAAVDAASKKAAATKQATVKRAGGGWVFGPGTSTSDSIDMSASNGEFVVNAEDAARNAGLLTAINAGHTPAPLALVAATPVVQVAAPQVRVFLGDRELRDMVRVEIRQDAWDQTLSARRTVSA